MHSLCTAELHITANNIKIPGVRQKLFYGEFMTPPAMQRTLCLHVKYRTFLSDFNQIPSFSMNCHEKSPVPNFTEIRHVAMALTHPDRRTDVTKRRGTFRDYTNKPKNCLVYPTVQ